MERYVLIRPGALGDALLALPALALLRRERPAAHVTLVARGDVLPLVRTSALADATCDWSGVAWAALFSDDPRTSIAGEAQAVVRDAAVVAWLADVDGTVARNLTTWGARQVEIAPGRPPADDTAARGPYEERDDAAPREHMALLLARALAPLGIAMPATAGALAVGMPPLRVDPRDDQIAARAWQELGFDPESRRVVALHAGSGGAAKRWPPQHFAELARRLIASGCRPLLVEGPADAAVTAEVLAGMGELGTQVHVARGLRVGALAALLRRCAGYAGNDSGVSHLAALAGVPTLALFGPSDPARWAPLGLHVLILRAPGGSMGALEEDDVWAALQDFLRPDVRSVTKAHVTNLTQ